VLGLPQGHETHGFADHRQVGVRAARLYHLAAGQETPPQLAGRPGLSRACYSCPRGYRKSIHPITSKRACRKRHKLVKARAKLVQEQGCPRGSFRHLGKSGGCYSCPRGWHRTINSIRSRKACARKLIGVMAADGAGICKSVLGAVKAGATGAQKVNKTIQALTAPVRKPVEAVMRKLVPPIKTPRSLNKLIDKAAGVMGRYLPVQDELRRVGTLAMRSPGKLGGILLNPRLMCEGSKKQIIKALVRAGLNPNFRPRRAGLMDGVFIKSAHAETNRTFHTVFISSGTRKPGKPVGLGIAVTLITDLRDHLRIYYSLPSLFVSRFAGYEFTAGYMIFPWTNIENFDQIGNLGLEISIGRGQTTKAPGTRLEKVMKGWPDGLGFNVSFDPGFVKNPRGNIPGFGISWAWGEDPGTPKPGAKVKSLSPSMSVDYSFPLR
jgi:hypothetical protein